MVWSSKWGRKLINSTVINGKTGKLRQKRWLEVFYIKYLKNLKLNRKKVERSPKI